MVVEIRLYKKNDMDLVALADAGYSIPAMLQEAVIAYANGIPLHFLIDEITPFDKNGKQTIHTRFRIPDSEQNAVFLMKNIKSGCRNSFCKILLRNALIQQNLSGFFARNELLQLQSINVQNINLSAMQNVKLCSSYKSAKQFSFAGKKFQQTLATPSISIPYNHPQGPSFQMPSQPASTVFAHGFAGYSPYGNSQPPVYQGVSQNIPSFQPISMPQEPIASVKEPSYGKTHGFPMPLTETSVPKENDVPTMDSKPVENPALSGSDSFPTTSVNSEHLSSYDDIKENEDTNGSDAMTIGFVDNQDLMNIFDNL